MRKTDKRSVLSAMKEVRRVIEREIAANAKGGGFGAGLSNEGFAGGYMAAIDDVSAALTHGLPSDHRGYWRQARTAMNA